MKTHALHAYTLSLSLSLSLFNVLIISEIGFREPERAEVFAGGGCHRGEYQGMDQERDGENQWFKRSINHHHYFT